jgi:hypothetical protein
MIKLRSRKIQLVLTNRQLADSHTCDGAKINKARKTGKQSRYPKQRLVAMVAESTMILHYQLMSTICLERSATNNPSVHYVHTNFMKAVSSLR